MVLYSLYRKEAKQMRIDVHNYYRCCYVQFMLKIISSLVCVYIHNTGIGTYLFPHSSDLLQQ